MRTEVFLLHGFYVYEVVRVACQSRGWSVFQSPVPERPISANPGLKFYSVFVFYCFLIEFDRVTVCVIISLSRSKGSAIFCKLELKNCFHPGLNLTIFRLTGLTSDANDFEKAKSHVKKKRLLAR